MTPPDLSLIHSYLDGTLSAEDLPRLETLLRENEEARRTFRTLATIEARWLELAAADPATQSWMSPHSIPPAPETKRNSWSSWWIPIAAAVLIVAMLGAVWRGMDRRKSPAPFATLLATTNARWADPNVELALSSGERLTGPLRLEAGRAEFQTMDGATVVIEGPASVRFADRKTVVVDEGRVFCQCPTPESRLSVITPQTKVEDLGTEFSVDARADESTRVAVLSGKVKLVSPDAGVLHAGESAEVRRASVVRLQPLTPEEMARLMPQAVASPELAGAAGQNRLTDPGFENALPSPLWRGTDECLEHPLGLGRAGNAVRIHAKGHKFWPLAKQRVATGDVSGRVITASVWAMSPKDDPLTERQEAVLKLAFLNAEGREFACSARHFLHKGTTPGIYLQSHLAARAPAGTSAVEVQLVLNSCGLNSGSVCFDDATLVIAADAAP